MSASYCILDMSGMKELLKKQLEKVEQRIESAERETRACGQRGNHGEKIRNYISTQKLETNLQLRLYQPLPVGPPPPVRQLLLLLVGHFLREARVRLELEILGGVGDSAALWGMFPEGVRRRHYPETRKDKGVGCGWWCACL